MHIADVHPKTADHLARLGAAGAFPIARDPYYRNIVAAADTLVRRGCGQYVYQTQWASGRTLWATHDDSLTIPAQSSFFVSHLRQEGA